MRYALLPDVCEIQYGYAFDSALFSETEGRPLIRIRDVVRGYTETFTTESCADEYIVHAGDLLIGMDGEFNIERWKSDDALLNQRVCKLIPKSEVDGGYLYYFMPSALKAIEEKTPFVTVKHLSAKQLNAVQVPMLDIGEQRKIAAVLDKVSGLIAMRKKQLQKLDDLVKARFVEMFGDPVRNDKGWPLVPLASLAEIKIGPFGSLLHKEDYVSGGHALVNPSHIVDGQITTDDDLTVTDSKYAEMEAYHLHTGDIVLGRRGEMGRCAVVYEEGMLCGTGSLIIRPASGMLPYFLQKIISYPTFKKSIEDMAVGVTMLNLNVPIVSGFMIPVLPLEGQTAYLEFVEQTDKSKLTIQQSLDKLELMKKALMQKYFG